MNDYNTLPSVAVIEGHIVSDKFLVVRHHLDNRFAEADLRVARAYQSLNIARAAQAEQAYRNSLRYRITAWWDRVWPRLMVGGFCVAVIMTAVASLALR